MYQKLPYEFTDRRLVSYIPFEAGFIGHGNAWEAKCRDKRSATSEIVGL